MVTRNLLIKIDFYDTNGGFAFPLTHTQEHLHFNPDLSKDDIKGSMKKELMDSIDEYLDYCIQTIQGGI